MVVELFLTKEEAKKRGLPKNIVEGKKASYTKLNGQIILIKIIDKKGRVITKEPTFKEKIKSIFGINKK